MPADTLHDRGELDETAIQFLEEIIEFQRIIHVIIIHDGHGVIFYPMFFQQLDSLHHFIERGESLPVPTVFVVELLRAIDRYTHQEIIFLEKLAPLIIQ